MNIYYTGAPEPEASQFKPELSLGGFKSNSKVMINKLNALFSDVSYLTKSNEYSNCKGFIVENDSVEDIFDVMISYEYPVKSNYKLEIAIVGLIAPDYNKMEVIENSRTIPYFAEFVEANVDQIKLIDNSINIGDLKAGKSIGLWLKLTPKNVAIPCSDLLV